MVTFLHANEFTTGTGAPKLNLTPEEKHIYGQLFRQADTEGVGVVTGEIAVKFFDKTRLDSRVLGEVSYNPVFPKHRAATASRASMEVN